MLITTIFGFIGFSLSGFSLFQFYSVWMIFGFITLGILVIYLFRNIEIYGFFDKKIGFKKNWFIFSCRFHLKTFCFQLFII
jgi:hypothetical protein